MNVDFKWTSFKYKFRILRWPIVKHLKNYQLESKLTSTRTYGLYFEYVITLLVFKCPHTDNRHKYNNYWKLNFVAEPRVISNNNKTAFQ